MIDIKNEKGITLVILVVTVTVMMIIGGVIIYNGIEEIEKSEEQRLLSELEIVNHAAYEVYVNYNKTKDESCLEGRIMTDEEVKKLSKELEVKFVTIPSSYDKVVSSYYYLTPSNLKNIGIYNSVDAYVVNYLTRRDN